MTLNELIHNCYRLQSAMEIYYLDDLDPVIHLSYEEAMDIYRDTGMDFGYVQYGFEAPYNFIDLIPPVPGTFWYTCFGIRTFVERIGE